MSVTDEALIVEYKARFGTWFLDQDNSSGRLFSCDSTVKIDHPIPEDERMWAFYVGHDCLDYDLLVTVVFDRYAIQHIKGIIGADYSENGCMDTFYFADTVACEFKLEAYGAGLGILFAGGFNPIFYTEEWVASKTTVSVLSWWSGS